MMKNSSFVSKFNYINKHIYFEKNFNHSKLRYTVPCNFLTKRALFIGIDHDTVCAGVVCADTPGTARVVSAVAQPRRPAPRVLCRAGVAAQTTTAQTVWVVNFYSTMKNEAIHNDKSRDDHDDEPPCWNALADNVIVMMKASIDTALE